ncbi:MAG: M3 family metallopeptidase [Cyclobacteriaceae bacterium]|nr:M3 family metallopeptidase [Cyclobacteriaceae bacterium]
MKTQYVLILFFIGSLFGCQKGTQTNDEQMNENPLLSTWNTPFGVPPFDQIKDSDYLPAFKEAMAEHKKEVDAIINNKEEPTFDNVILALERSGDLLVRISNVFYAVNSANSTDSTREIAKIIAPELSSHYDDINLSEELFAKVKAVYDHKDHFELNPEQKKLLEETYKGFVRSGVNLQGEPKMRLRKINSELAELSQKFGQNVLAETNSFKLTVTDKKDLGNLPESLVAAAAERSGKEGEWMFNLTRPSINPFLQYSPNREMRKKLFMGYALRGNNDNEYDNKAIAAKMAALRAERAQLLGYKTHADYILADNMAENPKNVYNLLDKVWSPALNKAKEEKAEYEEMMHADGVQGELQGWDWRYYSEKVREAKYNFNEDEMKPYFEVNAVRNGVFALANKLFGLTFEELKDAPKWHPDQQVYEVKEADGSHLGVVYMDFFTRDSKEFGAWMNDLIPQSDDGKWVAPVVTTNFNFPPPTKDSPSLLTFDEAQTLFHEFGHALHGLLSHVTYASLSGTNVPRDFVEFPSQVMENWMAEPEVLKLYAKNYKTGEIIPDDYIKKINASAKFDQGFATVEYMAASYLDMDWHTLQDTIPQQNVNGFEKAGMDRIGLIEQIIPRYRTTYFNHIFSGGYSAGYYSYLWSEVLDADAFETFKEAGIFDQETAQRYRHMLSQGGTRPGMELYVEFRGHEPDIQPLLERRGLE